VHSTFQLAVDGGVTAFCPINDTVKSFMPEYRNLGNDDKASLQLFHGVAVYYSLRSLSNGLMLATDGSASNYNLTADEVTLRTEASDAAARMIRSTVYDPVAIYALGTVFEPVEASTPVADARTRRPEKRATGTRPTKDARVCTCK
jgi:hypothetical protein